jgi:hypothetical protein
VKKRVDTPRVIGDSVGMENNRKKPTRRYIEMDDLTVAKIEVGRADYNRLLTATGAPRKTRSEFVCIVLNHYMDSKPPESLVGVKRISHKRQDGEGAKTDV